MDNYAKEVKKVGLITIFWNALLSIGKIISGILAKSSSLISDGIHSLSDILSTIVVMIGAKLSRKPKDKKHPFGHERMESISTIILAFFLFFTAIFLCYKGVMDLIEYFKGEATASQDKLLLYIGLGIAIASIVIKGIMFLYTRKVAKKINSEALMADSIHHLTDSISSFASLAGIIGLLLGQNLTILDPLASIIISFFIVKVAFDINKKAISEVLDESASDEFVESVLKDVKEYPEVIRVNSLKTRMFAKRIYVEVEIAVEDTKTVKEGHDIALGIHNLLEGKYPDIKHCMVHVDPASIHEQDEND